MNKIMILVAVLIILGTMILGANGIDLLEVV